MMAIMGNYNLKHMDAGNLYVAYQKRKLFVFFQNYLILLQNAKPYWAQNRQIQPAYSYISNQLTVLI